MHKTCRRHGGITWLMANKTWLMANKTCRNDMHADMFDIVCDGMCNGMHNNRTTIDMTTHVMKCAVENMMICIMQFNAA